MTHYLLDTNVISELTRPLPSKSVCGWFFAQEERTLFISSITIAEIMRGVARLQDGKKREKLMQWVQYEIPDKFAGRILEFDLKCGMLWGQLQGEADRKGCPLAVMDLQIAVVAKRFGLVLVTRNVKDINRLPVQVINPWEYVEA